MLQTLPITLRIHRFSSIPLPTQLHIASTTTILISMHGAALTHLLFTASPSSYLIELFLTNSANPSSATSPPSTTSIICLGKIHLPHLLAHKLTNASVDDITRLPINWHNMDSKNYWRNQDTIVNTIELKHVIQTALTHHRQRGGTRYLMFAPWEQYNNQIIAFKSACALASQLDRTLVLPHLGYRTTPLPKLTLFNVKDFTWDSFERYFDLEALTATLPCKFITHGNFMGLNRGRSIHKIRYHHLGNSTAEHQVRDYYTHIAGVEYDRLEWDIGVYYGLTKTQLRKLHGRDKERVLALGLEEVLQDSVYRRITVALKFSERVRDVADRGMKRVGLSENAFKAIHLRRGDYIEKCESLRHDNATDISCFQPLSTVLTLIGSSPPVYVMTNDVEGVEKEMVGDVKFVFLKDIVGQRAMVDQVLGIKAGMFWGNKHSSFSRHVIEGRVLEGKGWRVFE
ncbi:hypothetical protein BC829DRAFT_408682 [Chytridium lagenaria]|nr:hypothetical protein BC829DRAFT_408682 [Chytridium lagenaria]